MMDDANTENAESAAEGGIPQPKASRPSGSRLVWLNGAFALLKSGGIDAVKIMPLAKGLNLTRTGFYWHFKDLNALHEAMIARWASLSTAGYIQQCAREARTISHALFHMMDCWIDPGLFDPDLDAAVRHWARGHAGLRLQLAEADRTRTAAVADVFERFGYEADQARARGRAVVHAQLGYQAMTQGKVAAEQVEMIAGYVEMFVGRPISALDVSEFDERQTALLQGLAVR
jgi:AcrR family transcriptional regulator